MSLIKWEPFGELDRFLEEPMLRTFAKIGSDLAVDVFEEDGNVVAKMSVPGVNQDEIEVSIEGDILTISGQRQEEKETNEKNYYSKEIRRGSFARSVRLPREVEANKATAKLEDGMLEVKVPSIEGSSEKAVKVQVK